MTDQPKTEKSPEVKLQEFLKKEGLVMNVVRNHITGDDGRIVCKPQVSVGKLSEIDNPPTK